MNNKKNNIHLELKISALIGALSIVLGAFSAHALEKFVQSGLLNVHHLEIFEKGVKYQMYHTIVLLVLALFNLLWQKKVFYRSYWTILLGVLLFSGSLYWIALQNIIHIVFPHYLFWVTPLGGVLMIIGWLLLILDFNRSRA